MSAELLDMYQLSTLCFWSGMISGGARRNYCVCYTEHVPVYPGDQDVPRFLWILDPIFYKPELYKAISSVLGIHSIHLQFKFIFILCINSMKVLYMLLNYK